MDPFNPESDPYGSGWNIIQSKIAIGSGGFFGKGYGGAVRRTSTFFLKHKQTLFFLFWQRSLDLLVYYYCYFCIRFVLLRTFYLAVNARDRFCRLVIGGFIFTFGFNVMINLAMVIGLNTCSGNAAFLF